MRFALLGLLLGATVVACSTANPSSEPATAHTATPLQRIDQKLVHLVGRGRKMEALRSRSIAECGKRMRANQAVARAIRTQLQGLNSEGGAFYATPAFHTERCVSCSSDATHYCRMAEQGIREARIELAQRPTPQLSWPVGSYFVMANTLNVRLGPHPNASVTNRIHRQQRVDVAEFRNGWARISKYYDGTIEGVRGRVARWVSAKHLSPRRPRDLPQPRVENDPRINGLPKVGESGLSERDVRILYRGARHFLATGRCKKVEFGDKSVSRNNTYYVNCGGPRNLFFKPSDLPQSPAAR